MDESVYVVAACKPWNRRVFNRQLSRFPGKWHFVGTKDELSIERLRVLQPRFIFFLHWSWKVPEQIINEFTCVCFHMTDVPYGRGGSPLQNLIARGFRRTKLTALRMTSQLDAGPVYLKEDLSLEGNAEEIYLRAAELSAHMLERIVRENLDPTPQQGPPVFFRRRNPLESEIPELTSLSALYDFIRMLDAQDYPKAFIVHRGFRYEFRRAALYDGRIVADVTITSMSDESE